MAEHNQNCDCQAHRYESIKPAVRWSFSLLFVVVAMFLMKPLLINRLISRAEAYSACGMYNNAIRQCRKVLFIDRANSHAWNIMAGSYKNQFDIDNAVNTFLTAINIDSGNRLAYFQMGMIFAVDSRYKRAVPYFVQVVSLGPERPAELASDPFDYYKSALNMLATCYDRLGRKERAASVRERLKKEYPGCTARL